MANFEKNSSSNEQASTAVERFKMLFRSYVQAPALDCTVKVNDNGQSKDLYFATLSDEHYDGTPKTFSSISVFENMDEPKNGHTFDLDLIEYDPSTGLEPELHLSRNDDSEEPMTKDPLQTELALGRLMQMLDI